jgi:hypothetical protein
MVEFSGTCVIRSANYGTIRVFPTQWDTSVANFVSEPDFNAILTELGRLAAADSNQEQELLDALSYLVNKNEYDTVTRFVVARLRNSIEARIALLRDLHRTKDPNQARQDELKQILDDAINWHKKRNEFVHSRWGIPDKESGGVVRIKFDINSGHDTVAPVRPQDLNDISIEMEKCTKQLRDFFWKFGDYQDWLIKRRPTI